MTDLAAGRPRVVVVGLGPGGAEQVTAQTLGTIARIPHRYRNASSTRTEVLLSMTPPTP